MAAVIGAPLVLATCGGDDGGNTGPPTPVSSVIITDAPASMSAGTATQLTVTVRDASGSVLTGRTVTWTSSNASVATVQAGLVTAVAEGGPITVTATCEGKTGFAQITVTPRVFDQTGGIISSPDGNVRMSIPPDALGAPTEIRLVATPSATPPNANPELIPLGATWSLEPHGLRFDQPVTVSVNYSAVLGQLSANNQVGVLHWDAAGTFAEVVSAFDDTAAKTLVFEIGDFSSISLVQSPWHYTLLPWRWPAPPGGGPAVVGVWAETTPGYNLRHVLDDWQDATSGIEFVVTSQSQANIRIFAPNGRTKCHASLMTLLDEYVYTCAYRGSGTVPANEIVNIHPVWWHHVFQAPNATSISHAIGHAIGIGNALGGPGSTPLNQWPVMMAKLVSPQFSRQGLHALDVAAIQAKYGPLLAPTITSVSPNPMVATGSQTLTIIGKGFVSSPTVAVSAPGQALQVVPASRVTFVSRTQLQVTVAVDTVGTWALRVTNPDGQISNTLSVQSVPRPAVPRARAMGVGDVHSCVLRAGVAQCWGDNLSGQVGAGTTARLAPAPVTVPGGPFALITAGIGHSCALDGTGRAFCWGLNNFGQLGDGTRTTSATAVAAAPGLTFVDISAGGLHTCGLTDTGDVWCWGGSGRGELGYGNGQGSLVPRKAVNPVGATFATISAGGLSTCALSTTQDAYCWGSNTSGQLGIGTTTDAAVPTIVVGSRKFQAVAVGSANSAFNSSCGVEPNGAAWCWGNNSDGQLGIASAPSVCTFGALSVACALTPQAVSGGLIFDLVVPGLTHTCARTRSGQAACWGSNRTGELGDGSRTSRATPAIIAVPGSVELVASGRDFSCALTTTELYCWGNSNVGQVGTGVEGYEPSPVAVAGGGWQDLAANNCATTTNGAVSCWGRVPLGSAAPPAPSPTPIAVGGQSLTRIAGYAGFSCGLDTLDRAWCWGENTAGLGDGATTRSVGPVAVAGGRAFGSISVGARHACAVETGSGLLWCWGRNRYGQLGDGTAIDRSTPVSPGAFASVSAGSGTLSVDSDFTCAVTSAGDPFCWGWARFGVLGFDAGSSDAVRTPQSVPGVGKVSAVAAGYGHSCGLTVGGGLVCWGANGQGQLGLGTMNAGALPPTPVPGLNGVSMVSAGFTNTCVVASGTVKCWGENISGTIGDGTFVSRAVPTVVPGLTGITVVRAAGQTGTTCALRGDGTVFCWGDNAYGGVGAPLPQVLVPARVF